MREAEPRKPEADGAAAPAGPGPPESVIPDGAEMAGRPTPGAASDAAIVARISAAAHEPFREAWRRYEEEEWMPVRRALAEAAAAHDRAFAAIAGSDGPATPAGHGSAGRDPPGDGERAATPDAGGERDPAACDGRAVAEALVRYRDAVSDDVIEPLRAVLSGSAAAASLEESLARAAGHARAALAGLPVLLDAPAPRPSAVRISGAGPARAVKRACARVLGPLAWRGRPRRVPVARVARQHLAQVVLRVQARAFRTSQRGRADWLGRLERAWGDWTAAVLHRPFDAAGEHPAPPPSEAWAHRAAGAALRTELQALIDDKEASGLAAGADFRSAEESLAATVAVAGTFAADPPSSRPIAGRRREAARRWDALAAGVPSRLELCRSLVAMKRGVDGLVRDLRDDWARTLRDAESVLDGIAAELNRGRRRARSRLAREGVGQPVIEAERRRTDAALGRLESALPDPEALSKTLTAAVEKAIRALEAIRGRMPGTLALHDMPEPGDSPRRPTAHPRTVRPRETFLEAFNALRRERVRAAPSVIREAMRRVRSEVAELREVSGYGYEAAIAELSDGRASDSAPPAVLVTDNLARAAAKASATLEALREAVRATESRVAGEIAEGLRQLIEQVTADWVAAGYLRARAHLTAGFIRAWKSWRRRSARVAARVRAASAGVVELVRRAMSRLGLGPADRVAIDPPGQSLAHAREYPAALPVVYRRLFMLEPLTDPRLLAGREEELAAAAAAWARREAGDPRSLVVIAAPGAGVTSFLNIVANRLSEEAPEGVRRMFGTRVREEARLAASLARWLGLGDASDLDSLAERVLEASPGGLPGFAILEATEHLHMRAPGGGKLLESLLTFASRTESRVFWILAMTSPAWQLVEKRAPALARDFERVALGELSGDQLRRAIMARHRLSGLRLRFEEPRDGRAALRRRARLLRGTGKRKQERLIEADYFQRLHRASRGSIRLALFHWLRSADFAAIKGSLLVRPPRALDSGMGGLARAQSFALKAILEHGTLTVDEYRDVARASSAESLHILRSLEESRVIEAVPGGATRRVGVRDRGAHASRPPRDQTGRPGRTRAQVEAGHEPGRDRDSRYRIRPLMTGAVAAHLRSRNILH